jgi:hypothetical protein
MIRGFTIAMTDISHDSGLVALVFAACSILKDELRAAGGCGEQMETHRHTPPPRISILYSVSRRLREKRLVVGGEPRGLRRPGGIDSAQAPI